MGGKTEVIVANKEGSEDFFLEREDKFRSFENNYSLLKAVIDSITDPLFVKDIHGRYVAINSIAASMAGKAVEEFIGRDDTEIFPPQIASQLMENDRRIMATGKPEILEEIAIHGSSVKTYLSKKNVWRDPEGNIIGLVCLTQDITERKCQEAALKQQARILDQLCDSVITTDLNGIVTRWNKAAERLYGYSAAEAIGKLITFVYSPEQQDFFAQQILPVLQQHGVYEGEVPVLQKNGEKIDIFLNVSLETNELGEVVGMIGYAIDITERKRLEKERQQQEAALRESEERFRGISEQAAVGIAFTGTDGKFLWLNQKLCDLVGYTKEEMLKLSYKELSHPDDREGDLEYLTKIIAGENMKSREKRYIRKDGSIIWVNVTVSIIRDESGIYKYDIAIVEDISDRKRAEAALRESEERFRASFESAAVGIAAAGLDGKLFWLNQKFADIVGYTKEEMLAKTWMDISHPDELEADAEFVAGVLAGGSKTSREKRYIHKNGSIVWIKISISFVRDEQDIPQYAIGVIEDICSRKALEKELAVRQARFDAFFNAAPAALVIHDEHLNYAQLNQALADLNGMSVADCLGKKVSDVVPDLAPILEPMYRQIMATGIPALNLEINGSTPLQPGVERHWLASYFPLPGEENAPLGIGGVIFEITDRKRAEQALKESANKLELLNRIASLIRASLELDTILETVVISIRDLLEIDACTFAWYRQNYPSFSPVDGEDEKGSWEIVKEAKNPNLPSFIGVYSYSDVAPLADRSLRLEILRVDDVERISDPNLRQSLLSYNCLSVLTVPFQTQGGEIGTLSCSQHSVKRPWSNGEVELIKSVMDNLAIAIHQAELYKLSQFSAKIASERATELEQTLQQLQRTQTQLIQSEKMSSLGQLVAGVAHEINNPVSFIYGNIYPAREYISDLLNLIELYQSEYPHPTPAIKSEIEAIELEFLVEDLPKLLDSMKVGADRIREIVLSLRNFSRMDESQIKDVDIHEGIDSTLRLLQNRLKAKPDHPEIVVNKNYGKLPKIECYAGQLNQVFMNLLTNAIDALEERDKKRTPFDIKANPSTIQITTCVVAGGQKMAVSIADNGSGIPDSVKARIFDPFFTTKPIGKGTGLGLAISYQIVVEKHFGDLRCHSVRDRGTEFIMEIPIKQNSYRINT